MTQEIVKRIERVIVRVAQPEPLFEILTGVLGMPPAWPVTANPVFTSGGVYTGNCIIDILQVGRAAPPEGHARLYGLGFETTPFPESLPELARRSIPHTPPQPFILPDEHGWLVTTWSNVFLGGLIDTQPSNQALTRAVFEALHRAPFNLDEPGTPAHRAVTRLARPFLYDRVYRKGITYAVEYNPAWSAKNVQTPPAFYGLEMVGICEVVIGSRRLDEAGRRWRRLLSPLPERELMWTLSSGQRLRLLPDTDDRLMAMVWQVRSLNRAAQYLHKHELLGQQLPGLITIKPEAVGGLDIRIVA